MAVAWIDNLNVDLETGKPQHDAGHPCGFVPLEVRTGCKPKALLAARMIDGGSRDGKWFIAVCIALGNDPDISRATYAGIDGAPS